MKTLKLGDRVFVVESRGAWYLINTLPFTIYHLPEADSFEAAARFGQETLKEGALPLAMPAGFGEYEGFYALEFVMTTKCNLRCTHCCARTEGSDTFYGYSSADLDQNTIKATCDYAIRELTTSLKQTPKETALFKVFITGGEPLLNWSNVKYALDYLRGELQSLQNRTGVKTTFVAHIVSNGCNITGEIAAYIAEHGILITISLDTPIHQIRVDSAGRPATPKAIEGLFSLLAAGCKTASVNLVVPGEKIYQVDEMMEYLRAFGFFEKITTIQMSPLAPPIHETVFAGKGKQAKLTGYRAKANCQHFAHKLIEYSDRFSLDMKLYARKLRSNVKQGGFVYRCPGAQWKWCVVPGGDVFACHQLVNLDSFKMGNIHQLDAAGTLGQQMQAVQQKFRERTVFKASPCHDCVLQTICMVFVDCPARSWLECGDLYQVPQHYCDCAKEYLEKILEDFISEQERATDLCE